MSLSCLNMSILFTPTERKHCIRRAEGARKLSMERTAPDHNLLNNAL